jgi:hypothetical protein
VHFQVIKSETLSKHNMHITMAVKLLGAFSRCSRTGNLLVSSPSFNKPTILELFFMLFLNLCVEREREANAVGAGAVDGVVELLRVDCETPLGRDTWQRARTDQHGDQM